MVGEPLPAREEGVGVGGTIAEEDLPQKNAIAPLFAGGVTIAIAVIVQDCLPCSALIHSFSISPALVHGVWEDRFGEAIGL